ncbi:MAG: HAMP domain-containing histidine kinase [Acetatifactor sp.]|nr:HAMP domain-containing histidine kinase [Acetatifactor sp.]
MNTTQKSLLACSAVCYVMVLFSFLGSALWLVLIFFILHSVALVFFSYLTYSASRTPKAETDPGALKEQYDRLLRENTRLSDELSQVQKRCEEPEKIKEEPVAPASPAAEEKIPDTYRSLLPPIDPKSDSQDTVNIIQTAKDTIQEFLPFSSEAGIQLQVSAAADTLFVKADARRIRILFRNIIDNSIKYMKQAGNVVITISAIGDDIFIVLKDNGKGLPETETPHIFEMNYQGSNRVSGNGLGLTQAKAIVESYGGTIYAKSTTGKGMGIYIQIPVA